MEDKKPAEIEGYLFAAVAAGGRFLSFLFSTLPLCLPPALCLFWFLCFYILPLCLCCLCTVVLSSFCVSSFHLSLFTASRSCSLCLSVALSDGINYLSYEAPYLSLVASVDLLS